MYIYTYIYICLYLECYVPCVCLFDAPGRCRYKYIVYILINEIINVYIISINIIWWNIFISELLFFHYIYIMKWKNIIIHSCICKWSIFTMIYVYVYMCMYISGMLCTVCMFIWGSGKICMCRYFYNEYFYCEYFFVKNVR